MKYFPLILGVYTRETKEVFEFISKLISQAKRKCKFMYMYDPDIKKTSTL